jgi:arabinofuranan 3-O-arabinosyltransferase
MTTFRTRPADIGRAARDVLGPRKRAGGAEPAAPAGSAAPNLSSPGWPVVGLFGRHAAPREPPSATSARWFLLAWGVAFAVFAANAPGRIIFDTKLGVDIHAAAFYARLWHLWNPQQWFGTLQDQYIGYAVPMGPFYLIGQLLHIPVWIIERLWLSLLLAVAFWGMVKLATALKIGSENSRLAAGVMFALWPTFTIVIGSTSAAILPGVLTPWAILPLVSGAKRGSPMVAAARSGAVILLMGGVNAVSTIDALLLPGLYILTHASGRRRVSLTLWWSGAVAAATTWWLIPLLIQGAYSFNFLPFVEQAATTTRTVSAAAFLRGSSNWTAYFNLGRPWLSAGWAMVATPVAVLASATVAGVGLYGLARRDMPEALWLRIAAGIAALGALAGYWGPLGGAFHTPVGHLLDGALSPFRNVYKLEPVLGVILALGLAHAVGRWWQRHIATPWWSFHITGGLATAPIAAFVLVGLAVPYLSGQVLQQGSFKAVPRYWYQVADFLASHSRNEQALVVPADSHGTYLWGDPIDDPLEPLARSPWVERGLVPYGGAGSQALLTTAETAIESGEQVPGLPTFFQRAGIKYVVVRNDLDPAMVGYAPLTLVHTTLQNSGFQRVAAFGPLITGGLTDPRAPAQMRALLPRYPAVEVYEAASPGDRVAGPVTVMPANQSVLVNGGPDSLLQLAGQGLLGTQPAVIAGDKLGVQPSRHVVSDGLRRADNAFGLITSNVSYTYTATETNPPDAPLGGGGGPPRQLLPVTARGHQTVAVLSGAARVTASSSGSWLAESQQYDPVNAFDGNPGTAWTEGDPGTPVGQWIEIAFGHTVNLGGSINVRLLDDNTFRAIADGLQVSTAAGAATTDVAPSNTPQAVRVVPGPTTWLRIKITSAKRVISGGPGAGIRDVLIPGVHVTRYLKPAQTATSAKPQAFSFHQQVPSPLTLANPAAGPPLARTFVTPGAQSLQMTADTVALPGSALDAVLDRLTPGRKSVLSVSASSTWGSLPEFGPANLFTKGVRPWISGSANPVIHLSWHGKRRISRMVLEPAFGISAAPESVKITSPNGSRAANLGIAGVVTFEPPLVTDRMDLSFPSIQSIATVNPLSGQLMPLTVGLSKLHIPALAGLQVAAPNPAARFSLPCGEGPGITVDGHSYRTAVNGTVGALTKFLPMQVKLCAPGGALQLESGRHWLTAAVPGLFTITDVSLTNKEWAAAGGGTGSSAGSSASGSSAGGSGAVTEASAGSGARSRILDVFSWQPELRQLGIGPGPTSYLEIHENANPGWVATLNGKPLKSVRLDGWQQGFVVPAGDGGIVTLKFTPSTIYHAGLALSLLAIIAMLAMAFRRDRRRMRPPQPVPWTDWFGGVTREPVGGMAGAARRAVILLGLLALAFLIFVVGGPLVIAVPFLALLAYRWPHRLPAVALVAMIIAGIFAASTAVPALLGSGAFSGPAQACALIALTAALMPQLNGLRRRTASAGADTARGGGGAARGGGGAGAAITGAGSGRAGLGAR